VEFRAAAGDGGGGDLRLRERRQGVQQDARRTERADAAPGDPGHSAGLGQAGGFSGVGDRKEPDDARRGDGTGAHARLGGGTGLHSAGRAPARAGGRAMTVPTTPLGGSHISLPPARGDAGSEADSNDDDDRGVKLGARSAPAKERTKIASRRTP